MIDSDYPLINPYNYGNSETHHTIHGTTHHFNGHFQELCWFTRGYLEHLIHLCYIYIAISILGILLYLYRYCYMSRLGYKLPDNWRPHPVWNEWSMDLRIEFPQGICQWGIGPESPQKLFFFVVVTSFYREKTGMVWFADCQPFALWKLKGYCKSPNVEQL